LCSGSATVNDYYITVCLLYSAIDFDKHQGASGKSWDSCIVLDLTFAFHHDSLLFELLAKRGSQFDFTFIRRIVSVTFLASFMGKKALRTTHSRGK